MTLRRALLLVWALLALGCNLTTYRPTPTATASPTLPLPTLSPTKANTPTPETLPTAAPDEPLSTATPIPMQAPPTQVPLDAATPLPEGGYPTDEASGLPALPPDLLLSDSFDAPSQRWALGGDDVSTSGLEGGIYYVAVNQAGRWTWRLGPQNSSAKDIVIRTGARLAAGGGDGVYGLLCRFAKGDTPTYYNFSLTGTGWFRIARVSGSEWTFLMDMTDSGGAIQPAPAWNQVEVGCVGSHLWLMVNDTLLAHIEDSAYAHAGDFGFWAQARGSATQARAEFDNFSVWAVLLP